MGFFNYFFLFYLFYLSILPNANRLAFFIVTFGLPVLRPNQYRFLAEIAKAAEIFKIFLCVLRALCEKHWISISRRDRKGRRDFSNISLRTGRRYCTVQIVCRNKAFTEKYEAQKPRRSRRDRPTRCLSELYTSWDTTDTTSSPLRFYAVSAFRPLAGEPSAHRRHNGLKCSSHPPIRRF